MVPAALKPLRDSLINPTANRNGLGMLDPPPPNTHTLAVQVVVTAAAADLRRPDAISVPQLRQDHKKPRPTEFCAGCCCCLPSSWCDRGRYY